MKKRTYCILAAVACLMLCVVFTGVLLTYTRPMSDKVYNLSLGWKGESMPDGWVYDQKGWTVFTQEGDTVTELVSDGFGGFSGLDYPGQTYYFSRVLTEALDHPTLRLGPSHWSLAVFLDGELLYTDFPNADNRIGYLDLPMRPLDRVEPVVVTLPMGCAGKTLTIAQGTSPDNSGMTEDGVTYVQPVSVVLTCGYAYESSLISESFQVAIPAAVLFVMGVFLLGFFVWQVFHGRGDIGLVCAAMAAFLWMTSQMALTSFAYTYFGQLPVDVVLLCRELSRAALLAFLASRCTGKRRALVGAITGLTAAGTALYVAFQLMNWYPFNLTAAAGYVGLLSLVAALILGFAEWRREGSLFYGLFGTLTAAGIAGYIVTVCLMPSLRHIVHRQMMQGLANCFLQPLTFLMMATAIIAGVSVAIRRELEKRIESRLLAQRHALAHASYESMRKHQEQVMMLRHDITKHLRLLRQMTGEQYVADYLDEIMGENEKIRPVVQSGNEMLDIILNGKLTAAADAGIRIEIVRMQVPAELPLSSMELCSLFMNLMDNAVAAAQASGAEPPYIRLDLHVKGDFFVFSCKNSADWDRARPAEKKEAVPKRGLGLKIIRHISQRYGDLMETERGPDYYKVILAIPLTAPEGGQPSR